MNQQPPSNPSTAPAAPAGPVMDHWRIAILGDGGVGKTALAVQFTMNAFTYDPTIEDSYRKQIVVDEHMSLIEVLDTAGQDEYAALRDQWVREGEGFLLVYSISSRKTFERLAIFHDLMRRVKRTAPLMLLVGNKCDQEGMRAVSYAEGKAFADRYGCQFLEASAKTAQNVDRAFTDLIRMLRRIRGMKTLPRSQAAPTIAPPPPTPFIISTVPLVDLPKPSRASVKAARKIEKNAAKDGKKKTQCIIA